MNTPGVLCAQFLVVLLVQAELAEKHAELEATANSIIKSMEGKERPAIKHKLEESGIPESLISKLLPAEAAAAAPADGGEAKPAEGAKPEEKK